MNPMRVLAASAVVVSCVGLSAGCTDNYSSESCRYMGCVWKEGICLDGTVVAATQAPPIASVTPAPGVFQQAWDLEIKPSVVFLLGSVTTLIVGFIIYICQICLKSLGTMCKDCSKVSVDKVQKALGTAEEEKKDETTPTNPQTQLAIVSSPPSNLIDLTP